MSSKIYKVFISSTFKDLQQERKTVIDAILAVSCMPVAMEFFPASDKKPADLIRGRMNDADYYIVIIKGKYGTIDADTGKSYTEMEYDYATSNNIPVLGFIYGEPENLKVSEAETSKKAKDLLKKFTAKANFLTTARWTNGENLSLRITDALNEQFGKNPKQGFIKDIQVKTVSKTKTLDEVLIQKEKIGYIKFLHLSKPGLTDNKPLYKRYIPRLSESIDIFDELILYSINAFDEEISAFERSDVTSGVIDFNILYPWQPALINMQGIIKRDLLTQTFNKSSDNFLTASYFFNSFQENQAFRITMEKATKLAILIFDFTFLPGYESFIETGKIKAWVKSLKSADNTPLELNSKIPGYDSMENTKGMYWISKENLDKSDALVFDFSEAINWAVLKRYSTI